MCRNCAGISGCIGAGILRFPLFENDLSWVGVIAVGVGVLLILYMLSEFLRKVNGMMSSQIS